MCGRYISIQTTETLEKRFQIRVPDGLDYKPSYNISPGSMAPVITNEQPKQLQLFEFGFTPVFADKKKYLFNARAEGRSNTENKENFTGSKGIIYTKSFQSSIRDKRCLIIADAYYEGPKKEKLKKPYLFYLRNKQRPFCFAGIWDKWTNDAGEESYSFAIITIANGLLRKIGHDRMPVIIPKNYEHHWLRKDLPLSDVTSLLNAYPSELMNGYPVTPAKRIDDNKSMVEPIGQRLEQEFISTKKESWEVQGMGHRRGKRVK